MIRWLAFLAVLVVPYALRADPPTTGPTQVTINKQGTTLVDGKPFFPIAIWVYELNTAVMAELHEQRFNTIIGNGFAPEHLDLIHQHGMMAVPFTTEGFRKVAPTHPTMLAWYLVDEPETAHTPDGIRKSYEELKKEDPAHPIGVTHYLFDALAQFKGCSDFTMTDVYPITANRDVPLANVGIHMDEARRVNGANWPNWTFIQIFGGPETDGGKWAVPLPHEVRCMAFDALVHRANAILYFSYWPRAPQTWASVGTLNRDIEKLVPWLVAEGDERKVDVDGAEVHTRARKVGDGWIVVAVNMSTKPVTAKISIEGIGERAMKSPLTGREIQALKGQLTETFAPYEEKVYVSGKEPALP